MIKKWDIVLILLLLLVSFIPEGVFLATNQAKSQNTIAVVTINGDVYKEIPLSEHTGTDEIPIVTADGGHNLIVVRNQEIGITEADCPDKICIQEGFIARPGESVICLPHKLMIEVKAANHEEPDIIPAR